MKADATIALAITKGSNIGKLSVETDSPAVVSVSLNDQGDTVIGTGRGRDTAKATVTISDSLTNRAATAVINLTTTLDLTFSIYSNLHAAIEPAQ